MFPIGPRNPWEFVDLRGEQVKAFLKKEKKRHKFFTCLHRCNTAQLRSVHTSMSVKSASLHNNCNSN